MAFDTVIDKTKLENAMTATADAIREKTGGTDAIAWDIDKGFADAVNGLNAEEINPPGVIPANLKAAAMEVVNKVNEVRKDDSIVFMAMADSHHTGEQSDTSWQTLTNLGNLHAGMAAKVLSYALNLDFVCHLGDLTFGNGSTTSEQLHQQIGEMNAWLDEAWAGIPRFQTVGNHDTGYYAYTNNSVPMETNEYLFSVFGKYCEGAVYGSETYGYCYRDFDTKKLRVICLNTSEGDSLNANYECSPSQLLWFAQTLKSVGEKSGWSVIVLGHYPLDYYGMHDATAVVKAYIDGSSITLNGTSVNFSGSNNAKFVANFHGHTHCFKVARLNSLDSSTYTATEYNALRVGIPNTGYYRSNHQEGPNPYGLYFEEETTYNKTNDGVNDTAFVVNVITPSEEVVHSFCYGAGYDRVIGYGDIVYHKITKTASNATINSTLTSVEDGSSYTASITPNEHCAITSITVTMSGVDITSSVYTDGVISILSVTGDVVITVKAAIALACTNQIPISTDANGNIYNGNGYKHGIYVNGNNEYSDSTLSSTGFIKIKDGDVIRLKDMDLIYGESEQHCRVQFYNSSYSFVQAAQSSSTYFWDKYLNAVKDESNRIIQFTINKNTQFNISDAEYLRISCKNITDASIVTINEEIKYADEVGKSYNIQYNLNNAVISNNAAVIVENDTYLATITAKSGYTLDSITITMGGVDITSSVYADGIINIPFVTGNVVITVVAIIDTTVTYTNLLPISTDTSGNIYNGKGFKENTYLSSGNEGTKSGTYTSGFIACPKDTSGYSAVFYLKNVGMQTGQDGHRLCMYNADKSFANRLWKTTITGNMFTFGDDGNIATIAIPQNKIPDGGGFIRFCCSYIGDDSIVTYREPIE